MPVQVECRREELRPEVPNLRRSLNCECNESEMILTFNSRIGPKQSVPGDIMKARKTIPSVMITEFSSSSSPVSSVGSLGFSYVAFGS